MIHLDTSFLIRALVPGSLQDRKLRQWLATSTPLGMSLLAWAEFLCGPVDAGQVELASRIVPERAPFEEEDAALSAKLFNLTDRRRGQLMDCMIAASAVRLGAALATVNSEDFLRFRQAGLEIVVA